MFDLEVETPLGNQSPPEHVDWRKNGGDTPKMCSPELRKKSHKK